MDRRYQVFISSTYIDLVDERREVIQALLEMDCHPAGMELFPAANDDQWTLIRQVIDESDYYVVVVGGRYGSLGNQGVSFTEMEYDYAVSTGKPVLGFVHGDPAQIPSGKTQPLAQQELDAFVEKVKTRMVKTYTSPAELGSAVSRAMIRALKQYPTQGWVRGNFAMTPEQEAEVAKLRSRVSELELEVSKTKSAKDVIPPDLAWDTDIYELFAALRWSDKKDIDTLGRPKIYKTPAFKLDVSWNAIFYEVGPVFLNEASESDFSEVLDRLARSEASARRDEIHPDASKVTDASVYPQCAEDILVQLYAVGVIQHGVKKRSTTDSKKYWALTSLGQDVLMKLRAMRKSDVVHRD